MVSELVEIVQLMVKIIQEFLRFFGKSFLKCLSMASAFSKGVNVSQANAYYMKTTLNFQFRIKV
jgi:hypothetical protein